MKAVFDISNLSIHFDKKKVIDNLSLKIRENSITAIVGPSGCGKSTFLKSLNGLLELENNVLIDGEINFLGNDLFSKKRDMNLLRKNVAMLFQNPGAFPFSIERNLDVAFDEWNEGSREEKNVIYKKLLKNVSLWDEIDGNLSLMADNLSGGQQQRLCLIRSLLTNPCTVLLDEPCSALDPISTKAIERMLLELKKDKTIVIVTHDISQAKRLADDVIVMWPFSGSGRVVEHGSVDDIFNNPKSHITREYLNGEIPDTF